MMSGEEFFKRARIAYSGWRKRLFHLNMQLLYQCNFKCAICDFWKPPFSTMPQLSLRDIKIIAKKLQPLGPQFISLGGGEPLLHKELFDIIRHLRTNNFPVMICNGWYVTPETARELFKAGIYEVSISVDYASAAKHDAQRGREGAYERALAALAALQANRAHADQRVHMISVIMDDNIDEIEPLVRIAKELGVTYLLSFYCNIRGVREGAVKPAEIAGRLLDIQKRYSEFVALPGYIRRFAEAGQGGIGVAPCYAGKNLYNIDCQGQVTRCIDRLNDPVGNILCDSMDEIKDGLLRQFKQQDCQSCWTSCRGSIEALLYGKQRINDFEAYYRMIKSVPLEQAGA
ncbi:MAG: radical SAM protein [Desulfarculales bacterium]|jgi:MoaA/NifB/PqqE/SkfB family radical SAM enzyme|nr:radical SAM protein [Desulfarculales bacterium]